ncbi:MAG: cobalamin-binding protein [Terracidiphilus sp.]|jgi:iron complex transport system substrate-binding protein
MSKPETGFPRRIVCLSAETTEILYLLGEEQRIVGVSGFSTRPPEARRKPRISAFSSANVDAILALKPDLVLTFSDVQAEITRQLVLAGATVLNFNQRGISEILDMIATLARLVGKHREGREMIDGFLRGLDNIAASAKTFPRRPRVFFEEWKDPLISGIAWVEELIEIAGGEVIFPELRACGKSKDRVVDPATVAARDPEVILASWCGMKVNADDVVSRAGWKNICAVRNQHVYEIQSSLILQPGPAALTEGVRQIHAILARVAGVTLPASLRPGEKLSPPLL